MEESRLANYHDLDAQPAVDSILPGGFHSGSSDGGPSLPTARNLIDELDPYDQKLRGPNFTASLFQGAKVFPKQARELICSERINVLLVFVPIGITVGFLEVDPIIDFILNALAIIPLAVVISTATESIASRLGDTLGALLNVTVGNTAELMIFFVALAKNQIRIVQASLLGSVSANLLLVLGTAFLTGGLRFANRLNDRPAAHMSVGMLDFGLLVSMFPVAFLVASRRATPAEISKEVLAISRATSIGLIVVYIFYLIFQMKAQSYMRSSDEQPPPVDGMESFLLSRLRHIASRGDNEPFSDGAADSLLRRTISLEDLESSAQHDEHAGGKGERRSRSVDARLNLRNHSPEEAVARFDWQDFQGAGNERTKGDRESISTQSDYTITASTLQSTLPPSPPSTPPTPSGSRPTAWQDRTLRSQRGRGTETHSLDSERLRWERPSRHDNSSGHTRQSTLEELREYRRSRKQQYQTPLPIAIIVLVFATILVSICTEQAVDAIPSIVQSWGVSQIFLGFIVLPVVGNAAEHIIAAKLAMNNKMVLAKKVAVESSAQIVLFIMPTVILIGWVRSLEMSMQFDIFEIASIVMTSVVASILVCRGKGDWRQGMLLHTIFLIVSIGAAIYPTTTKVYGQKRNVT